MGQRWQRVLRVWDHPKLQWRAWTSASWCSGVTCQPGLVPSHNSRRSERPTETHVLCCKTWLCSVRLQMEFNIVKENWVLQKERRFSVFMFNDQQIWWSLYYLKATITWPGPVKGARPKHWNVYEWIRREMMMMGSWYSCQTSRNDGENPRYSFSQLWVGTDVNADRASASSHAGLN